MPPQLDLTTPLRRARGNNVQETRWFQVRNVNFDFDAKSIIIGLLGENRYSHAEVYIGAAAANLLNALQSANYGVKNLQRQILERLVADGRLQGTISIQP